VGNAPPTDSAEDAFSDIPQSRGKFWEVTFQPAAKAFPSWPLTEGLATETGKTEVLITTPREGNPGRPARAINLANKTFDVCDINHFDLKDSSFRNCTFRNCRFIKANFDGVKFSGCRFERCHFLNVHFIRVQFIGCSFASNSASGELVYFQGTSISAQSFIDAIVTNLAALPSGLAADVQTFRLLATKTKLAGSIFRSVKDEPDLDQFFDATRTFELAAQRQKIAEAGWFVESGKLRHRDWWSRVVGRATRLMGLWMMLVAGSLTNWGRSPAKSAWLLAGSVTVFTVIYAALFDQSFGVALMRALDNTFVFGYTPGYLTTNRLTLLDVVAFVNAFAGFCWYALLIPVIARRIFR
jgi:hypothetical protein